MAKGEVKGSMAKCYVEGPSGPKKSQPSYDTSKGALGMRQSYKQSGKPGNGSK